MGLARTGEFVGSNIEFFTCYMLLDITDTGIYDPAAGKVFEQAQNLNLLLQTISLGSQPTLSSVEKVELEPMADYEFGSSFTGNQTMWVLRFASERQGTITVSSLERDIAGLPVYAGLDETATFVSNVFETTNPATKNIYFIRNDNL